jgi:hypothetical protein
MARWVTAVRGFPAAVTHLNPDKAGEGTNAIGGDPAGRTRRPL